MENLLRTIIEGVSNNYGETFFQKTAVTLREVLAADYTFIARLDLQRYTSRTIALATPNGLAENFEYSLRYTPCSNVADDSVCLYPQGIQKLFPEDQLLMDLGVEGYIGTPLYDSQGKVMGLTVALFCRKIENPETVQALFEVFSGRISAEIERTDYENQLEQMVAERTQHLQQTMEDLKQTQAQLIMQEKLASLGGVVAGVAHEMNTPLGIAKTANSYHQDQVNKIRNDYENEKLTASALHAYLDDACSAADQVGVNLDRAIELVKNFKLAAVERIDDTINEYDIAGLIQHLNASMRAEFRRNRIFLHSAVEDDLKAQLHAADFTQVLSNLLMNACVHAFPEAHQDERHIAIKARSDANNSMIVEVSDNGVGVDETIKNHIFEPFVTSKRNSGGTGLGMSIVYNIVAQRLQGNIELVDTPVGTTWRLVLPKAINVTSLSNVQDSVSQRA